MCGFEHGSVLRVFWELEIELCILVKSQSFYQALSRSSWKEERSQMP